MTTYWDVPSLVPPINAMAFSNFLPGVVDLRWDDPSALSTNSFSNIVGVNIYRSEGSDRGPYLRINEFPISGNFYRDRVDYVPVTETVSWDNDWISKGDSANRYRFTLKTKQQIVKRDYNTPHQTPVWANSYTDVTVYVDGVEAGISEVFGRTGEVTLINVPTFGLIGENKEEAVLPKEDSVVEVCYTTIKNFIGSGLGYFPWYRLTTVSLDPSVPTGYRESELDASKPFSKAEVESLDYIWKESVRRNQWILQQGGERVKVFVRKICGLPCSCTRDLRTLEYAKQAESSCPKCYGVGILGGYEGPYDIIIGPDDGERRISQTAKGRRVEHTYEVFTGPTPLLTMKDFIVKQTDERFSIGAVRRPSNRGNILQQHFTIGVIDESDVRHKVPIDGVDGLLYPQTRRVPYVELRVPVNGGPSYDQKEGWVDQAYPLGPDNTLPVMTDKEGVVEGNQQRGRSKVWENQNY